MCPIDLQIQELKAEAQAMSHFMVNYLYDSQVRPATRSDALFPPSATPNNMRRCWHTLMRCLFVWRLLM